MITTEHLTYRYPQAPTSALHDISLKINDGESVCIMGNNGSGKSTLAMILAGLITGYEGLLSVVTEPVGILFQNPDNQMVATKVVNEVAFALENLQVPNNEMVRQVAEIMSLFRIEHLAGRLTSELSGGEKQRVCLASVVVTHPHIVIFDEPDSFLDVPGRELLEKQIARLRSKFPEMIEIRITQYPSVAGHYPRLILLRKGEVAADGRPESVLPEILASRRRTDSHYQESPGHFPIRNRSATPEEFTELRIQDVSYRYSGQAPLLKGCNIKVRSGETIALAGPSGAGKSTLSLLMCGLLTPDQGAVLLADAGGQKASVVDFPGTVVASFQQPERQFFLNSCAEEIAFGPGNLGKPMTTAEINDLLNRVGLQPERFACRDPLGLSMGEKRRLAFAVVLAMNPAFIVFDEPTCGLDIEGVRQFAELSLDLKERGVGQLIITHEGWLVRRLADLVAYLSESGTVRTTDTETFFTSTGFAGIVTDPEEYAAATLRENFDE